MSFLMISVAASAITSAAHAGAADDGTADEETVYVSDEDPELIEVSGRALETIGNAMAGSSGTVGYEDLKDRPILRVGEILEVVPGLVATQHSGTGKANQFFLRGFNLDHGTDFATFVDGVPLNMRSHGHGQGYTDLNILIPELVERVDFKKGTHHTEVGDFGSAGSASIRTYDKLEDNLAKLMYGSYGYRRALVTGGVDLSASTHILAAAEEERYDGPFEVEEDFVKRNGFLKLSGQGAGAQWRLSMSTYDAEWRSTDQVPQRLIDDGTIDLFGTLDPDLGGNTQRYSATAEVTTEAGRISAYFVDYEFQLFSNFTYFLNDPFFLFAPPRGKTGAPLEPQRHSRPNVGDEFEQFDQRQIFGGDADYSWSLGGPLALELELGASIRHDDIGQVGLYGTQSRVRHTLIREDAIKTTSYSGYSELRGGSGPLRFAAGLRVDAMDVDVTAVREPNSGTADDSIVSPKLSLAYRASDQVELYANYGEGFHSNDARGATISIDPENGKGVDPVPLLVKSRGAELGLRFESGAVKASVVGFWLELDSELVYVGDAGTVEVNGGTRRYGVEANVYWQATDWASLYATYGYTNARFMDEVDDHIPNAVPLVLSAGLKLEPLAGLTSSLILRHVGAAPLIEDDSVRSEAVTTLNWGTFYRTDRVRFGLEILNLLNSRAADISYFFESRLEGEVVPVADVHLHPMAPRQVRFSAAFAF